ncbi:hypothetical protein Tco_1083392, partial [Tanacetum coccineum]
MAYRLKLPLASAIHSGFHVSQLKKMIGDQRVQSNFPNAYINKPVIEPDRVLGTRKVEGKQEVLIWPEEKKEVRANVDSMGRGLDSILGLTISNHSTKALAVNYVSRSHPTTNYQCDQLVSLLYLFVFVLYIVNKIYDNKVYMLNCLGPEKGTARVEINRITRLQDKTIKGNLKRNIPQEDVDAPFESGVVRVFKQPGIECPCDEDDYIQKPWKPCFSIQGMVNKEPIMASQLLALIGTFTLDTDAHTKIRSHTSKTLQRGSTSSISGAVEDHVSNVMFETEYKVADNVKTSLGDWGNAQMDQQ